MVGLEQSSLTEALSDKTTPNTIDCRITKQHVTHHKRLTVILDRVIILIMVVILLTLSLPACFGLLSQPESYADAPYSRTHSAPPSGNHGGRQIIYSA